jgi:hypothetical protein
MWSPKMTKEQFLDKFSKKSRLSRVQMRQAGLRATACPCGLECCDGFLMVQDREEIEA